MNEDDHKEESEIDKEKLPPGVILKEHAYDGIREYDQRLPSWWLITLHGAILFSIIYWIVLDQESWEGETHDKLEARLAAIDTIKLANSIDVTNDELFWEMVDNPTFVSAGKATYDAFCVACHGVNLEGGIGFNLVDSEWIHGSKPSELYLSVANGFQDKGMLAWEPQIGQKRVAEVVAYVLSRNDRGAMEAAAP